LVDCSTNALNPSDFGVHKTTKIFRDSESGLTLLIDRKRRVIRADVPKIIEKLESIKKHQVDKKLVSLVITSPLCSKAKKMLEEMGFEVKSELI
jgi:hypothetical protein